MTISWYLQGVTPTAIDPTADDILRFSGAAFINAIPVGDWNDSTHVKTDGGSDKSSGNTPNNNKFISQAGGSSGKSQADWGDGTEDLDLIQDSEAALKINLSDASDFIVHDCIFYSYNGVSQATAPSGMNVKAAEVGDENFVDAEGSGSPLALADQSTPATSHDFYIVLSKSPTGIGLKTSVDRFEGIAE